MPADAPILPCLASSQPVTLVGGGPLRKGDLEAALALAPRLAAADGGAGRALALGHMPEAAIGDLDSLAPADAAALGPGRIFRVPEQDSTDFDKCLRRIAAPAILGVGFLGGRVDHALACFEALMRHAGRPVLLAGARDVVFHAPPAIALELPPGSRLSLFPLAPLRGRSAGLVWPIDDLLLAPGRRIGTSNAVGPEGRVRLALEPGCLVIAPRAALGPVWRALGAAFSSSAR